MLAPKTFAIKRQMAIVNISSKAIYDFLLSANPIWRADGLVEEYAHCRRKESVVMSTVQDTIGNPRSFAAFAHDYATRLFLGVQH